MAADASAACIMKIAPVYTTVRVNTLTTNVETAKSKMIELMKNVNLLNNQFALETIFCFS